MPPPEDESGGSSYGSVKRWSKKVKSTGGCVFKLDKLIVHLPTHLLLIAFAFKIAHRVRFQILTHNGSFLITLTVFLKLRWELNDGLLDVF